jgi:hypothetical protein
MQKRLVPRRIGKLDFGESRSESVGGQVVEGMLVDLDVCRSVSKESTELGVNLPLRSSREDSCEQDIDISPTRSG